MCVCVYRSVFLNDVVTVILRILLSNISVRQNASVR